MRATNYYCSKLTSVAIGKGVSSIADTAFRYCSLTKVNISDLAAWVRIEFSDYQMFGFAYDLYLNGNLVTNLVIPYGVTSIGNYAFYGCSSLKSVTIPSTVTKIGKEAFVDTSVTSVYSLSKTPPTIVYIGFSFNLNPTLHVPVGCRSVYANAECWKNFSNIVEDLSAIEDVADDNPSVVKLYNLDGQESDGTEKGIYIVKYSDGTTKKVLVK